METRNRPNVVVILTDDQGPWALGCAGNSEIQTPNIDSLAATGMRFANFFCTSPVCSPARASLMTGRIPSQHGIHDWIRDGNDGPGVIRYLEGQVGYTDVMADAGYTCGLSGKWHMGDSATPQKGFGHWYAHQKGSGHYYNAPMYRDGELVQEPGYITDLITDDAIAYIRQQQETETPFYLSVHYTAPHSPWLDGEHPRELTDLYADCPFDTCPQEPYHPDAARRMSAEDARDCLIGYFAAVTGVDRGVGRLVGCLEDLGIRDDTLICYVSDNGFNCGHHGVWGKGNGTLSINMYETSVKVPALFSQPGSIGPGVAEPLVSGYDFMPTLLDYLDLPMPSLGGSAGDLKAPGTSFASLLNGGRAQERESVVVYDEYGPARMIRTAEWKYVHRYNHWDDELYDMQNDPDERANLVDDPGHRDVVRDHQALLEEWFDEYADPALDGKNEAVTGNGQTGRHSFDQNREVSTDPRYDPGMKKSE